MNQGAVAGAGIAAHLHQHVVPRWGGDQNFMPIIGRTKTLPQLLGDTRDAARRRLVARTAGAVLTTLPLLRHRRNVDRCGDAAGTSPIDPRGGCDMFARSTTIQGDPGSIEAGIVYIRDDVMPAITAMDGCLGLSLVIDRESGRCIATSSWDSAGVRCAPAPTRLASYRARGRRHPRWHARRSRSGRCAAMHRDHATADGACCRITWAHPRDLDATIETWRTRLLATVRGDGRLLLGQPARGPRPRHHLRDRHVRLAGGTGGQSRRGPGDPRHREPRDGRRVPRRRRVRAPPWPT